MSGCPASIQNITVNRFAQEIVFINKRPPDYISKCGGDDLRKSTLGKVIIIVNINLSDMYKNVNKNE